MKPFSVIFWAILMVLSGVVLLIKHLGGLKFSAGSVIFGLFVILLGISLMTGGFGHGRGRDGIRTEESIIFSSGTVTPDESRECNVIFSSGTVDLREWERTASPVEINVIFSSAQILLPEGPVKVKGTSAFGQISFPDGGGSVAFGDRTYTREGEDPLVIEINCVFGNANLS